jgi:tetratricopeptide (TPR) repeat protein
MAQVVSADDFNDWATRLHEAKILFAHGKYQDALEIGQHLLDLAKQWHRSDLEGAALSDLGNVHLATGSAEIAQKMFEKHLELATAGGDKRSAVIASHNLSNALNTLGKYQDSFKCLQDILEYGRQNQDYEILGACLCNASDCCVQLGKHVMAAQLLHEAIEIFALRGDTLNEARAHGNLGILRATLCDFQGAEAAFSRGFALALQVPNRSMAGQLQCELGGAILNQGRRCEAKRLFWEAVDVAKETGNLRAEAVARSNMGRALEEEHDYAGAREQFEAAIKIAHSMADVHCQAINTFNLAHVYSRQREHGKGALNLCLYVSHHMVCVLMNFGV